MASPKDAEDSDACDESRHISKGSKQLVNILRNSGRRNYQDADSEGERRVDERLQPCHFHPAKAKSSKSGQRIQMRRHSRGNLVMPLAFRHCFVCHRAVPYSEVEYLGTTKLKGAVKRWTVAIALLAEIIHPLW